MKADHKTVSRLVSNARGQLDAVLRMIEEDRYCMDISTQLLAAQSIIKRANREVLKGHVEHCIREAMESGARRDAAEQKVQELLEYVEKMTK